MARHAKGPCALASTNKRAMKVRVEKEEKVQRALKVLNTNEEASIQATAAQFDVDKSTLSRQKRGAVSITEANQSKKRLSAKQEEVLVRYVIGQEKTHYGSLPEVLEIKANLLLNFDIDVEPKKLGVNWVHNFYNCNESIAAYYTAGTSAA